MKIFISHSTSDRWVARRISDDLTQFGFQTFLDEKDIETGESIDDAIQENLQDCDELLILLSPVALESHWVLLEIGGAKALGKRLIPILLHVGANELPNPISKGLARDLNEIDKYYDEVRQRASAGVDTDQPPPLVSHRRRRKSAKLSRPLAAGDLVRIASRPQSVAERNGIALDWSEEMNEYFGRVGEIIEVDESDNSALLDIDEGEHWWAFEWLTPRQISRLHATELRVGSRVRHATHGVGTVTDLRDEGTWGHATIKFENRRPGSFNLRLAPLELVPDERETADE